MYKYYFLGDNTVRKTLSLNDLIRRRKITPRCTRRGSDGIIIVFVEGREAEDKACSAVYFSEGAVLMLSAEWMRTADCFLATTNMALPCSPACGWEEDMNGPPPWGRGYRELEEEKAACAVCII